MTITPRDIAKAAIDGAYEMLRQNGLENEASTLARELRRELDANQSVVSATLVTPSGDAGAFAAKVQSALEKRLGRSVELRQKADKKLLGGAVLEYGDTRIDFSARGTLDSIQDQLASTSDSLLSL